MHAAYIHATGYKLTAELAPEDVAALKHFFYCAANNQLYNINYTHHLIGLLQELYSLLPYCYAPVDESDKDPIRNRAIEQPEYDPATVCPTLPADLPF
jgi:hypothetical protein